MILRDYDDTYEWNGDGSFEQRTYMLQNWRADVVAILDSVGEPLEHVRYSPYGVPSSYPLADVNRDGLIVQLPLATRHFGGEGKNLKTMPTHWENYASTLSS